MASICTTHLFMVFVFLLLDTKVSCSSCDAVSYTQRQPCHFEKRRSCERNNCCWDDSDSQTHCFHKECHCSDLVGPCVSNGVKALCSSCQEGWAGDSCDIEIPRLSQRPVATGYTLRTISIRWNKWRKSDPGDGPVESYQVYHRPIITDDNEAPWLTQSTKSNHFTFTDLEPATNYEFAVYPVYRNIMGYRSETIQKSTCSAPLQEPRGLALKALQSAHHSELIVQAKWKSLLRSYFGCHRIQHYNIYYTTNGAQNLLLMNDTASTNYVITHVNLYDNFTFGVSAVNSANLEGPRSVVNLHGRSHSVEGLSIGSSTFSEITLSWEPPLQTNGALLEYEIQYRLRSVGGCEATSAEFSDPISVDPRRHFYTLRNIYPYTVYVVRVRAITAAGQGKMSEITANTLSRAPNSTITTVHVIRMSKRSATLDWESPDCNLRYGRLISYRYELHHVYNDTTHSRVVSRFTNETDVTFTDLVPNNLYSFSVAFMTDHGQSSMSNAVQFSTHPDVPPVVTGIHVLAYSSSLFIEWRKPTPNHGELTAYELKYTDANTQQYTQVHLSPQQTTHSIEALKQDTTYLIQVRACNVVGCGQWSRIINKHTSPAVPEAPVNFTNTTRTANSIRFSWEPPLRNDGEIISYKISCQSSLSLRNSEFVISPTQYYVNVERLKPNTLYICTLHAVSQHGSGTNVQISAYTLPQVQGEFEAPVLDSSKSTDETLTVVLSPRNVNRLQNIDRQKDNDIYYIIIESISLQNRLRRSSGQSPCNLDHTELVTLNYNLAMTLHSRCYVAAALNDLEKGQEFTVGDNVTYNGFYNAPLVKGQEYNVWVAAIASGDGVVVAAYRKTELSAVASQSLSQSSPVTKQSFALTGIIIAIVVAVALAVIVLVIVVFRRRHFSQSSIVIVDKHNSSKTPFEHTDTSDMHHTSPQYSHIYDDYQRQGNCDHSDIVHQQGIELDESDDLVYSDNELKPLYSSPKSETVVVQDLWSYVQKGEADKLNQQYQALPSGLHSPCTVALLPQNKVKNRYGNIIAYDHSRVKLIHAHGDTDYINANYIDGYKNPDAFIAAQGPSRYTISDMWLMIWQQNSTRIVMVTNLVENTMLKCETYWPQAGTAKYGEIKVTLLNMEELAMYTIRTFQMEQGSDSKIVRQFHFTSWPDHGVPKHATSLINFRRKVRSFDDNKGPIVVHCSAGVGRTGTFIGLDYLLDCAEATGKVNVFDCVNYMRQQRVNMVQTIEQYEFVYKALVEAVKCGDTSIHSVDIHEQYDDVCSINSVTGKRKLIEQFELLDLLSPSPESTFHLAVTSQNIDKNRNTNIIPLDGNNCVYLQTFIPGLSNYINAVFIDGYLHTDSFIATQMPLQETVVSFWCMIYDHKCKTIVMCNQFDQSLDSCYWPDQGERCNFGPFIVQLLALDQTQPDITIRDLQLTYDKELNGTFVVRHFEYHAWVENALIPSDTGTIINLLQCVEKWQQQSGNSKIVVHCLDGASQSGLFIAASHLIERLKLEREVDVFQSCKQIRINRPQFVPNMAQYQYLYEIAIEYIDGFEIYSNFK